MCFYKGHTSFLLYHKERRMETINICRKTFKKTEKMQGKNPENGEEMGIKRLKIVENMLNIGK